MAALSREEMERAFGQTESAQAPIEENAPAAQPGQITESKLTGSKRPSRKGRARRNALPRRPHTVAVALSDQEKELLDTLCELTDRPGAAVFRILLQGAILADTFDILPAPLSQAQMDEVTYGPLGGPAAA